MEHSFGLAMKVQMAGEGLSKNKQIINTQNTHENITALFKPYYYEKDDANIRIQFISFSWL